MMKFYITYLIHYYCNLQSVFPNFGSLWFEHNYSSTQMRCLTNPALARIYYSENIRFERMLVDFTKISFKLIAINHSANSLFTIIFYSSLILFSLRLIPRRLERRTYSYQKHTLPIKLRNLVNLIRKALNSGKSRALRLELRIWSLKLPILPIKLYSFI